MKKIFLILLLGLSTVFMPIIDNIADAAPRHYSGQHHYKSRPGVYRPAVRHHRPVPVVRRAHYVSRPAYRYYHRPAYYYRPVYRPVYYADYYRPYHHGYYNYGYYGRSGLSDGEKIALGIIGVAAIAGALSD